MSAPTALLRLVNEAIDAVADDLVGVAAMKCIKPSRVLSSISVWYARTIGVTL
jgi:hypothetical protein